LLYATILHLLAGAVAGSVFRIQILFILLGLIFVESVMLTLVHGNIVGLWAPANFIGVQLGYLVGIYGRRVLEQAGYLLPRTRRIP
jgi:hypothetical protein